LYSVDIDTGAWVACACFRTDPDACGDAVLGSRDIRHGSEMVVYRVSCDPKFARQGHASKVMKAGEMLARKILGQDATMWLETSTVQLPACKMYVKLGYEVVFKRYVEFGVHSLRFEKKL